MDGRDGPWTPREHDHVVEPIFAGLHGHEERRESVVRAASDDARSQRTLWLALAVVTASILARAWMLA